MKALEGIKILDFTHVQSGPTCTQLLAWFGADVIKVERPGVGDATRGQLRDIPDVDSLYFTMLNHNKRSIEINGKKVSNWICEGDDRKFRWRNWPYKIPAESVTDTFLSVKITPLTADRDINMFKLWMYQPA